jgi:hypothetical protein
MFKIQVHEGVMSNTASGDRASVTRKRSCPKLQKKSDAIAPESSRVFALCGNKVRTPIPFVTFTQRSGPSRDPSDLRRRRFEPGVATTFRRVHDRIWPRSERKGRGALSEIHNFQHSAQDVAMVSYARRCVMSRSIRDITGYAR